MALTIADTDVIIDYFNGIQPAARIVREHAELSTLAVTAITRFEILSGTRDQNKLSRALRFFDMLHIFPLDAAAADRAASVRRELEARGEGIGTPDSLIAGIALTQEVALLTRNSKHFKRIDGLSVVGVNK